VEWGIKSVSPDEVISGLKNKSISSSRATLLRFENAQLISVADRGSGGRGLGKYTEYPADVIHEYFASYHLMKSKHVAQEQVANARGKIYAFVPNIKRLTWERFDEYWKKILKQGVAFRADAPDSQEKREAEKHFETQYPFEYSVQLAYAEVVSDRNAIIWWEYFQISEGIIDPDYDKLFGMSLWTPQDRPTSNELGDMIVAKQKQLREILQGLDMLAKMAEDSAVAGNNSAALVPLEHWIRFHRKNPEVRPFVRNGILANYRSVPPSTFDLIISGKLPEV
jgi:hypothetical protein